MQTTKVKGEVQTLEYTPGERLKESKPPDEGIYQFTMGENRNLKGIGKGWKSKPGKFPNRLIFFKALDTEDEVSGKEKECREIISLSPGALRRGVMRLAQAAQYPLKLQLGPDKQPNHPTVKANAIAIDKMLMHIKAEEAVLRGEVSHEEFNGETQGRVKWLPPDELEESASDGEVEAEAAEDADADVFGGEEGEGEAVAEDEAVAEEEVGEEVAEEVEVEEPSEEPEDAEFEAVPAPKKKPAVKPVAKKPAPKPVAKKKK